MHDDAGAWRRKLVVLACAALLTATSTVGCAGRCRAAGVVAPPAPEPPKPAFEDVVLGRSVEGNDLVMSVLPGGPETVLVIGGVHGSEPTSVDVARGLLELLREQPEMARGKTVAILANANPDGYAKRSRYNANKIDINRNFAATNYKPAMQAAVRSGARPNSEPETRAIVRAIARLRPDLLISIHSIGSGRECNNYDGPAEQVARVMSGHNGYPPAATIGYPTPGSLGSYAGIDRQIPMITLELPRTLPGQAAWDNNRAALLAAISAAEPRRRLTAARGQN
jgi:predicted deacylase